MLNAHKRTFEDERSAEFYHSPHAVFAVLERIGGENGWFSLRLPWVIRGRIDELLGGPGLRRPRRHPRTLQEGDAVGFFLVSEIDRPTRLVLKVAARLPGKATLSWEIHGHTLTQRARFHSESHAGNLYWYALLPIHLFILSSMLKGIIRSA
ncbi:hypothetical protein CCICO_05840 [Corynebacterium ciconiae DSM 44920]|uniref:DUF2867 domain-containing protein n=1 Tax=Corynebacterium ciconiae TaxID=227319 RepID=UPI0003728B3E|nr:DUF2867 domain-containing protein [Corynebacterium ciconiae]WKD61196.1 hypothetical protein CCICO_05840 [Corynebacterium ciconiae DSM 44920]